MTPFRVPLLALALTCCANTAAAQGERPPVRDPDRGLDAALRERLALVDAARDTWVVEHWSAAIEKRLKLVAALWADERLEPGLADADWIAAELRVAPLFAVVESEDKRTWRSRRGLATADATPSRETFTRALAAWRRAFRGASRLDFEVIGFTGEPPRIEARIRVCASGSTENARVQHNAVWSCAWRFADGVAELVDARVDDFEAVELPLDERGLFADVTETVFDDPALYRERLAPGLEHWRRRLSATLFPGSLGHHGFAVGDVDGDGLEDLYVCRPGGLPNLLLRRTPRGTWTDIAAAAGVDLLDPTSSGLLVDLDGDADADLVVSTGTGLVFFANDGKVKFEQKGLLERSLATSLAAADFDVDGDVDLYVCSYLSPYEKDGLPVPYHDARNGEANMLLRNDGAWSFVDATAEVGLDHNNDRFSFAASWEDFDDDGDQDLYVANDFGRKNLYRNDGGRFRDVAKELGAEDVSAGMGVDWADVDHDGRMDAYVTNMHSPAGSRLTSRADFRGGASMASTQDYRDHARGNTLLLNIGERGFRDASDASGTAFGRWGWGSIFVDFDDDGAPDLFAPNGFVTGERELDLDGFFWRQVVLQSPEGPGDAGPSYSLGWRAVNRLMRQGYSWNGRERNVAYWNVGGGRFADVSSAIGLDFADDARAAARIDFDDDGDEDLIVTNRTAPMLRMLENRQATGNGWIAFELRMREPQRTALGARIELETDDGRRHLRTLRCGTGYLAQSTARIHFGLGRAKVRRVGVRWPSGESEDFGVPAARAVQSLVQGSRTATPISTTSARAPAKASTPLATSNASTRTVLPTPLPLPRLALETWDGRPAAMLGITLQGPQGTGRPLLLMLWSVVDEESRRELERIGAAADVLRGAGIEQVLALCVDAEKAERERAVAAWKDSAWPFARAFIGEEGIGILEAVEGALHDHARGLTVPTAFLVDPSGRVVAVYQGPLDAERVTLDLALFDLDAEARRDAAVPFRGRWIGSMPQPLDGDVAARLRTHGLERPAGEYELARVETRELSPASFEYEMGAARQRQGRLDDAILHFRRAVEADPTHVDAARSLAVALHQQGQHADALAAYREALRLDPAHALTRCNLGLLHLALGDVDAARGELRALQTLQSELAETLEAKIRERE